MVSLVNPRQVVKLQGETVTSVQVLHALPQVRWAHFATHGFFADPELQSVLQADPNPLKRLSSEGLSPLARNPLVLSGLVLNGKPERATGTGATPSHDRDILTAEAIAGLPLKDLDLAVLSACETGLGTVAGGEGVFGLQRAFHLAGTRTVIASLWSVPDRSTQILDDRAVQKSVEEENAQDRSAAAGAARDDQGLPSVHGQEFGQSSRRPGQVRSNHEPDQLPPLFWAAFVLSGDWR